MSLKNQLHSSVTGIGSAKPLAIRKVYSEPQSEIQLKPVPQHFAKYLSAKLSMVGMSRYRFTDNQKKHNPVSICEFVCIQNRINLYHLIFLLS